MLWEIDIYPLDGQPDRLAAEILAEANDLGLGEDLTVQTARGYLIEAESLTLEQAERFARELLADGVVERTVVAPVGDPVLIAPPPNAVRGRNRKELPDTGARCAQMTAQESNAPSLVHVLPKPGVMDPVADSARQAMADFGIEVDGVRTFDKYWLSPLADDRLARLCDKVLANDAIEQVVLGPIPFKRLELGGATTFELKRVVLREFDDDALMRLSREGQLYLDLTEMQTIRSHFRELGRDPTDVELETIAQTWSEHCSHKTLAGRIAYRDGTSERRFDNMLRETIFSATEQIRQTLGEDDWCVSVFQDNAGIVRFDQRNDLVFKVETHNHPSALEPYGGANTGIGGVIRDTMGTGLAAKPIASTDIFCFARPDFSPDRLPDGVLHPRRVIKGVVSGVRDYGNRMGIPTVNGAVCFDDRYLGNPLVFCGSVGIIPHDKSHKRPRAGDWIVAVGGRTGRDGIHGATFSSAELTSESEELSGGAVQIGNAIEEKMVLDVLLAARDRDLYHAITDCGAGGFSSAVGEMGEEIGAEVWLDRAPLKYAGLTYTEIWISEAQERMVLAVPPEHWEALDQLCGSEGVEATIIGRFVAGGTLELKYNDVVVGELTMEFLHHGRPPVVREAIYRPVEEEPLSLPPDTNPPWHADTLMTILGSLNVASKEWIIRQYDHEVQGGSVIKPLVGAEGDGPSDAAVLRPLLASHRGVVIGCGINPRYGDLDPYHMATSAIDEAIRNCVAVGADPRRIAILDNFCWGNCGRSERLGGLVRAALACHDLAVALGTPFISGKDSLNNEFSHTADDGTTRTVSIPPTLLISAMGQISDVRRAVTMDLKEPGNVLYQVGVTKREMGGSHFALVHQLNGGCVPKVDAAVARRTFDALFRAIDQGLVRACHDLSEGGLAVAIAEMAFAGAWGARLTLDAVPNQFDDDGCQRTKNLSEKDGATPSPPENDGVPSSIGTDLRTALLLFSESNSRFLCEVRPDAVDSFQATMEGIPHARIGSVVDTPRLCVSIGTPARPVIDAEIDALKRAWQAPLRL
ncbi:MAG: phosphoribosylformylglycinamidine synthase subunit PurL [Pirellulales bacterium]